MSKYLLIGILLVFLAGGLFLVFAQNNPQPSIQNTQTIQPATDTTNPQITMNEKEIVVEGFEFGFEPNTLTFKQGEKAKLTFKNQGKYPHNLVISDLNVTTKTINPNETDTIEFTPSKSGAFSFVCTINQHEQKGMKGTALVNP